MLIILRNLFILSFSLCLMACMKEVSCNTWYLFICIIKVLLRHIHNLLICQLCICIYLCLLNASPFDNVQAGMEFHVWKSPLQYVQWWNQALHSTLAHVITSLLEQICCSCQRTPKALWLKGMPRVSLSYLEVSVPPNNLKRFMELFKTKQ